MQIFSGAKFRREGKRKQTLGQVSEWFELLIGSELAKTNATGGQCD